ncbi:hypothetical protein FOA52_003638 [Chlamydomonas sp. UWO 241]|nr:hypothetical protein FOA52_003638 [Chlamydomonas sp. UWO 241]
MWDGHTARVAILHLLFFVAMEKPKMLVGEKGVKYGLQIRGPATQAGAKKPAAVPVRKNVFGADSDSEEDIETQIARQADKKRAAAKVQAQYEDALAQDASVFDYDGVYDSMQEQRVQPKQQEKIERKSRYIAQLKDQAEGRKRESDVQFERRQLKDRAKEDHLFEDKEVFVTAAYRKKLEEQKLWEESERKKEEEESKYDVRSVGHMGNFYANLLTSNVAFGTGDATKASGSAKAEAAANEEAATKEREAAAASTKDAAGGGAKGGAKEEAGESGSESEEAREEEEFGEEALKKAAAKVGVTLDKYELMRLEADKARRRRAERAAAAGADGAAAAEAAGGGDTGGSAAAGAAGASGDGGGASGVGAGEEQPAAAAAAAAGKRRNDETTLQSARERYLARKKQQTEA